MTKQWELSGNAENADWSDLAMTGRAYADNLVGEPTISKLMHKMADEIDLLRGYRDEAESAAAIACLAAERFQESIRRLANQDATLSVQGGNVTVTMDGTLTDEEQQAIEIAVEYVGAAYQVEHYATILRKLLERLKANDNTSKKARNDQSGTI